MRNFVTVMLFVPPLALAILLATGNHHAAMQAIMVGAPIWISIFSLIQEKVLN